MNLSFAGCGFLGIYHVGVAGCLGQYAPQLWADQKIFGASAGALAACGLITRCDLGKATTYVLRVATEARKRALGPLHPSFCLVKYLREGLHAFLPDNAHEISSNRLFVSLTRVSDRKNVRVSQFDSKEDLIEALICSAFVPFYCGIIPPKYHGVRYVDGGCTDNLPVVDGDTITVSPFAGESDICPTDNSANFLHLTIANTSIQLTAANLYRFSHALFPPHPEVLTNMCQQGFDDALKYLQRNDLITCTQHLSMHSKILSTDLVDMTSHDDVVTEEKDDIAEKDDEDEMDEEDDEDEEDEEEDEEDKTEMCALCRERQHVALIDSLPQPVVSALQESCDAVNRGLLAPLYKMRLFKVVSLMAAPWILPFDIVLLLSKRFYEWAPYMPSDMQWFVKEFRALMRAIVDLIQTGRHRYSARLSCQLAITELGYGKEEEAQMLQDRPGHGACHHEALHLKRRGLNVGFSVDFKSRAQSPIHSVNEIRQHILDDEDHSHVTLEKLPTDYDVAEVEEFGTPRILRSRSNSATSVSYDTFENCLHIANQMDSLLSFYYQEEDDPNVINVTEIFPLSDPNSPKPDFDLGEYRRETPGESSSSTSKVVFKCPLERRCSGSFTLPTHFEETE